MGVLRYSRSMESDLLELDRRHLVHPYLPVGDTAYVVFERGEGVFLYDVGGRGTSTRARS
jgi:adenosylmethionine-8-amino-7-oxononanoate aminotransferase